MRSLWRVGMALWMAWWGHRRQVDRAGRPYMFHVERVAWIAYGMTGDPEAAVVGLLHDYFEDVTIYSGTVLKRFGEGTAKRIWTLTRWLGESDAEYVQRVCESGDVVVLAVKIADRLHNLDARRGGVPNPARTHRYLVSMPMLVNRWALLDGDGE